MEYRSSLSALLDDAGTAEDLAALDGMLDEPEAHRSWWRYQLIGEVMRGSLTHRPDPGFVARTSRLLADEAHARPADVIALRPVPPAATPRRWAPVTGLATAAALAAFVAGLWTGRSETGTPLALAESVAPPAAVTHRSAPSASGERVSTLPEAEYRRRMQAYLADFHEERARAEWSTPAAPTRPVSFERPASPR